MVSSCFYNQRRLGDFRFLLELPTTPTKMLAVYLRRASAMCYNTNIYNNYHPMKWAQINKQKNPIS